jgi:hypothetical protein
MQRQRNRESDGAPIDQLFWNQQKVWSGRGDLNARPPAPKTVSSRQPILPVFNYLRFKQLRPSCCGEWNGLELGGPDSYIFIYSAVKYGCSRSGGKPVWLAILTMGNRSFIS